MDAQPLLSVIIPNWNGKHFLGECVDSLKEQTFRDFETILVDNGSTDGSVEFAEKRYGDFIRIIKNKKNLGFTGGNNVGIQAARGRYIVLLNNDTWAEPTWLEELVKATHLDHPIGMWASKIYSYYRKNQIEATGFHFSVVISKLTGQNKELAQRHALLELEFNEFKKRYLPSEIRSS